MNADKDDPFAECRAPLARLARELAKATPGRRAELVEKILPGAHPGAVELLAEALVELLGNGRRHADAASTLLELGPAVLPALESALFRRQSERRLLRLVPVIVTLGRALPEVERVELQLAVGIAAGFASTPAGRAALDRAMWDLGEREGAGPHGPEVPPDEPD